MYEASEYSPLSGIGGPIGCSSEDKDVMDEESDHVPECQQEVVENESSMNTTSEQSQDELLWCGYKFVGDVDKNVKPSRQHQEIKGKSLHYFHAYTAKDQVNLALLSECPPPKSVPDPNLLLPPAADVLYVMEEISILMSR